MNVFFSFAAMPWLGIDIGGSLVKVVYFEPTDSTDEAEENQNIKQFVKGRAAYCNTGSRDAHLQVKLDAT